MEEIRLENADVGPLMRSLEGKRPWLLALAAPDCPPLQVGDPVRLWYPGDSPRVNPAYPPGEWVVRVRSIRVIKRATEMTPAELTAVFDIPESNPAFMSQVWMRAAKGRDVRAIHLLGFDFV